MKKFISLLAISGVLLGAAPILSAADSAPKSVIHIVTVAFKEGTTPAQIQAALDGVQKLPSQYKGITRVWTKAVKVQNLSDAKVKKTHVIVMEFASEKALADYSGSDAQKEWYKVYEGIRQQSTTFDVTN
ncbi:MAG: Dabb family protein [Verrucomicrobia bacterium]|nr:Dabb family protein [Verrucomicrobiota bacterium]